jgi:hypothetical protein
MKELFERDELAALDGGTAFANGSEFGFGGRVFALAAFKVLPPGFTQELAAGAVFLPLDAFHLLDHCRWQRDGQSIGGSHIWSEFFRCYLL